VRPIDYGRVEVFEAVVSGEGQRLPVGVEAGCRLIETHGKGLAVDGEGRLLGEDMEALPFDSNGSLLGEDGNEVFVGKDGRVVSEDNVLLPAGWPTGERGCRCLWSLWMESRCL
jgi:hypothetical protein